MALRILQLMISQLIVVKNGGVLNPAQDFTLAGSNIIFNQTPLQTDDVFVIALATTADLTRTINYVIDSGSSDMLAGNKGKVTLDVSGVIESITVLSDQTGNVLLRFLSLTIQIIPHSLVSQVDRE